MKESQLQSLFTAYIKKNKPNNCVAWELKIVTKGKPFNFKKIEPNQLQGLLDISTTGIMWKLSDLDFRLKPCDCIFIKGPAYLGICWYEPRKDKLVYLIGIQELLTEMKKGVKSITEDKAKLIASKIVKI